MNIPLAVALSAAEGLRGFRGSRSSDYTGAFLRTFPPGAAHSLWAAELDPCPGPPPSCVCLKARLNPSQQLSQIRSQISAKGGGGGAEGCRCRLQSRCRQHQSCGGTQTETVRCAGFYGHTGYDQRECLDWNNKQTLTYRHCGPLVIWWI